MTVLSVNNLGKAYRSYRSEWGRIASWFGLPGRLSEEHWVLRNISFDIQPGEAIGIVGQNGAGKSTLLKMITGTLRPTEGQIHIGGRISAILELGMGFNPELTGRQNAHHSLGLMGFDQATIHQLLPGVEEFAEIAEYFDQPIRTYSSGMQMRVAFAVATAVRPEILIVDEALSVGDAYFQAKCYSRVNEYKQQGMTLILVSHAVGDIVKHCDRALLIRQGALAADGAPRDITNLYLDELFGKKNNEGSTEGNATIQAGGKLVGGTDDLYNTRPYYRKEEHRWGHGGARIIDYLVVAGNEEFPSRLESQSPADFYFKILFEEDFDSIVPGMLIKTIEGIFLYGTNSFLSSESERTLSVKAGEVMVCRFSFPVPLNEGHYLVSFGVSSGNPLGELVPLDRRYDSIILDVSRPMQFWGIVDMNAKFAVAEKAAYENESSC